VNPPTLFAIHVPPFKQGLTAHGSPIFTCFFLFIFVVEKEENLRVEQSDPEYPDGQIH
jgi:hypothetical protein